MKSVFALAAAAAFALAAPASAATVTVLGVVMNGDFFTNVAPDAQTPDNYLDVTGTVINEYRDVYEGTTLAGVGKFNVVKVTPLAGSLTYNLVGGPTSYFTMIWGTIDDLNLLTINNTVGGPETVTGAFVKSLGGFAEGASNVILKIVADNAFDSVTLTTGQNSFEHAFNPPEAAIPVPAAGLLLVTAIGGLGVAARRRKSA